MNEELNSNEEMHSHGEANNNEEMHSEAEVKNNEEAPMEAEVKDNEKVPSEAEVKGNEEASSEAEIKDIEEAPSEAEVKGIEEVPSEAEVKNNEEAPSEAEVKDIEEVPSEAEVKNIEEAPSEAEVKDNEKTNIKELWNNFQTEFKEQLGLNDQNELFLLQNTYRKERILGFFKPENWGEEAQKLQTNFKTITTVLQELQDAWQGTEDKLSLQNKIHHFESQLQDTPAIGDYHQIQALLTEYYLQIDSIYEVNNKERQALVDEAISISEKEDWQVVTEQYKDLLERWKEAPEVKRSVNEKMWAQINEAKDAFFERKRKYYEDLEKEQMVNLDKKLDLCERAEALQESEKWKETTDKMNELLEEWKTIGHLPSQEKNEEMWERFSQARKTFFHRKHEHSKGIREEQEANTKVKLDIVEEAELISKSNNWKQGSARFAELQKLWDATGRATQDLNDSLWERWKHARNSFYEARRTQAKEYLQNLQENYDRKKVLTERAEHLAQSQSWKLATDELLQLMTEWKTIGPVPKEYGDELWNRFNAARRLFFKRKDEDRDKRRELFNKRKKDRVQQTEHFLHTLIKELKEDEDKHKEFSESVQNLREENKKEIELKSHLNNLIEKLEKDIERRKKKIEEVEKQLEKLTKEG